MGKVNDDTTGPAADDAAAGAADLPGLDHLERQAAAIEQGATAQQAEAEQRQAEQQAGAAAAELLAVLQLCRTIVAPAMTWWPEYGRTWSDPQLSAIAHAGADVMQRHGLSMGELLSTWGPYIALIGAALPPSLVTYAAIKARREGVVDVEARPGPAGTDQAQQPAT
jgi:hypothetical protein